MKHSWPGWKTIREIGSGSFGAVYEIEKDTAGFIEKAALKVVSIPESDSDIEDYRLSGYDDESIRKACFHVVGDDSTVNLYNSIQNIYRSELIGNNFLFSFGMPKNLRKVKI